MYQRGSSSSSRSQDLSLHDIVSNAIISLFVKILVGYSPLLFPEALIEGSSNSVSLFVTYFFFIITNHLTISTLYSFHFSSLFYSLLHKRLSCNIFALLMIESLFDASQRLVISGNQTFKLTSNIGAGFLIALMIFFQSTLLPFRTF